MVLGNKLIHKEVKRRCAFRASEKTINHSGSWLLFSHLLLIHLSLCKKILKRFYSPQRVSAHRGNDFCLLCVARSASVFSVVQKIKTLFTTEVTEFIEVEIKPSMMFVLNVGGSYPAHFIKPCAR